jgi:hypothetical protein
MTFLITVCVMFGQALMHPLHFLQLIWNPQHAGWIALGTLVSVALGCAYALLSIAVEAHRAAG